MKKFLHYLILGCVLLTGCYDIPNGVKPQPKPPTPIVVKSDSLWIITIDTWEDRAKSDNADTTALLGDTDYWATFEKRGHKVRHWDASGSDAKKYQKQVDEAGGPPCLVLVDVSKKTEVAAKKLPSTKDAVDTIIKTYSDK